MPLYLIELTTTAADRPAVEAAIAEVARQAAGLGGELIESQVTRDLSPVYVVIEAASCAGLRLDLEALPGISAIAGPDEVRLVGADLDDVKSAKRTVDYLVEWDIPDEIGMEDYLARKKAKAPLYAEVPEVSFLRTYVREDTSKCLCLYDAPDESAVRRARAAVSTPVSRLYALGHGNEGEEG
ncbi:DUF4242 domain-containing protein [Nonomuraea sp. LP-02]|uniref:DUF4242 domain-containing protein n=1 Tax=Nonomuraea sp. LP-02 TaxID=3097960 RepID=UPI002E357AFE|nr:DUF4242 domain-containing protein [Nonomuraea sp. LP-02]MED7925901.1 DUF4242 domain-containing protein [Nonomuraea sp. LP-02]